MLQKQLHNSALAIEIRKKKTTLSIMNLIFLFYNCRFSLHTLLQLVCFLQCYDSQYFAELCSFSWHRHKKLYFAESCLQLCNIK